MFKRAFSLMLTLCVAFPSKVEAAKSTGVPRYDVAVRKAIDYLTSEDVVTAVQEREKSLIAYALLKAGEPTSSPLVHAGIEAALERVEQGHGSAGYDHIYLAGVDALLLADADQDTYQPQLQTIVDYVQSAQAPDGSWNGTGNGAGDTSMNQYGMLAIWAAHRAGAQVSPEAVDRTVSWHIQYGDADGGWGYRPPSSTGSGGGRSTHNCTMAAAGSLGIGKLLLYSVREDKPVETKKFGELTRVADEEIGPSPFTGYKARTAEGTINERLDRAFSWTKTRFHPEGHQYNQKQYFFYALERAAALNDIGDVNGGDWFEAYGDVLLSMQSSDGSFEKTTTSPRIATCFAILYFVRSTKQILKQQYGAGIQSGNRGLDNLFSDGKKKKKELTSLGALLGAIQGAADQLDGLEGLDADEVVESVTFGSREELVGQVDTLKKLLKSPDAANRQAAYFALGRTGDYKLIPLMLEGLRDPNVDVTVEAIRGLRYISRKPGGFGITLDPFKGKDVDDEQKKLAAANIWRDKAAKAWGTWYRGIRPYEESGGLDEIRLLATP